jgi:hypothetical protein
MESKCQQKSNASLEPDKSSIGGYKDFYPILRINNLSTRITNRSLIAIYSRKSDLMGAGAKLLSCAISAIAIAGCSRPPLNPGDKFCLDSAGFGGTKFFEAKSVSYPWVEAKPNAACVKNAPADMTFWINLEAVPAFSPNCVCKEP